MGKRKRSRSARPRRDASVRWTDAMVGTLAGPELRDLAALALHRGDDHTYQLARQENARRAADTILLRCRVKALPPCLWLGRVPVNINFDGF